jgi:3-hydroxybutyryl-CoA dehydrogenase
VNIKNIGIIGFGVMGSGITQVCAQCGYSVLVHDVSNELINKGMASINSFLSKSVEKGKMTQADKDATMSRIKGTTKMDELAHCDLVIEAVVENIELKRKIFKELDKICRPDTILATNTSCLSISDIAAATSRPDKVLGLHFFNPVPLMKLLELVKTIFTTEETVQTCKAFGASIGKNVVIAKDIAGFIGNRLSIPFTLNAIRMLESGVASREDIDAVMMLGFNHPLGPLALADLAGLDTLLFISNSLYEEFKEPQYAPPALLKKMVTFGWLGRKTGKGFYDYAKK